MFAKSLIVIFSLVASLIASSIEATQTYVREVPPNMPNSALFTTLTNYTDLDIKLLSASSSVAKTIELHAHSIENGMMKMHQVPYINIKAHGSTQLKPGGYHVMLIGLNRKLKEGDSVDITLHFDNKESISLNAPIHKVMRPQKIKKAPMKCGSNMKCGAGKCGR